MLTVDHLYVYSRDISFMDLMWEFNTSTEDINDYTIEVERSGGYAGPWDIVSKQLVNTFMFTDSIQNIGIRVASLYYRLKITDIRDSSVSYSTPTEAMYRLTLDGIEMMRQHWITMREHTGRMVLLFSIRTMGQRCPSCYDANREEIIRSNCPACYSVGFVGGYYNPILLYMSITTSDDAVVPTMGGTTMAENAVGVTIGYPKIKSRDIIVEEDGSYWVVNTVKKTERLRSTVSQTANMTRLLEEEAMSLPVDFKDPRSRFSRDFTNPHYV